MGGHADHPAPPNPHGHPLPHVSGARGMSHGKRDGLAQRLLRLYGAFATLPFRARRSEVAPPRLVAHRQWGGYLSEHFNKPGLRVLELGSRNVTGVNLRSLFSEADYTGFDFYPGENVDVVGDIHRLSACFEAGTQFDLIFCSAVLEHLHMPWVAAVEIQKMLKLGGHVFVETHFSFSAHERPWHFFQFSEMGLRALFNDALGFDLLDSGMGNPIAGFFTHEADAELRQRPLTELYCHSAILCRKSREVEGFDWSQVSLDAIVEGTRYPPPA